MIALGDSQAWESPRLAFHYFSCSRFYCNDGNDRSKSSFSAATAATSDKQASLPIVACRRQAARERAMVAALLQCVCVCVLVGSAISRLDRWLDCGVYARLAGLLIGPMFVSQTLWLAGWFVCLLTDWLTDLLTDRQTDRQAGRQTDRLCMFECLDGFELARASNQSARMASKCV